MTKQKLCRQMLLFLTLSFMWMCWFFTLFVFHLNFFFQNFFLHNFNILLFMMICVIIVRPQNGFMNYIWNRFISSTTWNCLFHCGNHKMNLLPQKRMVWVFRMLCIPFFLLRLKLYWNGLCFLFYSCKITSRYCNRIL